MKASGTRARHQRVRRLRYGAALLAAAAASLTAPTALASPTAAQTFVNWPAYLFSAAHSSYSPATAITPANAGTVRRLWSWRCAPPTISGQPVSGFVASPVVYNGTIYIGCNTGVFYAVSEVNHAILWSRQLGYVTDHNCAARGIASTATVAVDPVSLKPAVFVAGGSGYLYSLDAATGGINWQTAVALSSNTVNDYYMWSSPTVAGHLVYIGVSSQCDTPLVPNSGLRAYNISTGKKVAEYDTMPPGEIGGSIWSSAAATGTGVFVDTGNNQPGTPAGDSASMVSLSPSTLAKNGSWAIPPAQQVEDNDWAASPTLFRASLAGISTPMVLACNKNGYLYAFNQATITSGPVWGFQVGAGSGNGVQSCLGATIWNGKDLFQPGNATTINGVDYEGSMRELDPATGKPLWETGLPEIVLGSPSLDAGGVIAAPTFGVGTTNGVYLLNAANGAVIKLIGIGKVFAQPVFADGYLIIATAGGGLNVYAP